MGRVNAALYCSWALQQEPEEEIAAGVSVKYLQMVDEARPLLGLGRPEIVEVVPRNVADLRPR
jgi:hypothetical protein